MTSRSIIVIITALLFSAKAHSMSGFTGISARDTLYAGRLFRKASGFESSAEYDSSVFYYQSAAKEYLKRRYFDKYLECRNRIISAKKNAGYSAGLITEANENIALSIRKLGNKVPITGDCYFQLGNIYTDTGNLDSALICYETALNIRNNSGNNEVIPVADIYRNIGIVYLDKGIIDSARNYTERSLNIRRSRFGENESNLAHDYNIKGAIAYHLGQYDTCEYYFGKVAGIREKTSGSLHPLTAKAYNNLAVLFMEKAMWDTALTLNRKAYEIRLAKLPPNHPDIALSLNNMANVYEAMGDNETALDYHQKALNMRLALYGTKDHTDIAMSYTNIGVLLRKTGRFQEGRNYFLAALDILIKKLGEESPYTAAAYNNVGAAYDDAGDYNNCLKYLKKALSLRLHKGMEAPGIPSSYNNIGTIYKKRGDLDLALAYYRISKEIIIKTFNNIHPVLAATYSRMGDIFLLKNQNDTALYYYNKALTIDTSVIEKNNPSVIDDFLNRGTAYGRLNDPARELGDYLKGLELSKKIYGYNHTLTGKFYSGIARNMLGRQDADSAISYMRKALRISEAAYPSPHPNLSSSYREMGFIYESIGFPDSAMIMYNKSINTNYRGFTSTNRIELSLVMDGPLYASSLMDISRLKYSEYFKTRDRKLLLAITNNFDIIKSLTQSVVSDFLLEETKIGLFNELSAQTFYGVDAAYRLFRESGSRDHLFKALEFSELNKATLLKDLLFRYKGENYTNIPDSLLNKRKDLAGYIDYLRMQTKKDNLQAGTNDKKIDRLLLSLREINDTISLYADLEKEMTFPTGRQIFDDVIKSLEPGSALISYFLNDSSLFTFVISDDTLVVKKRRLNPAGSLVKKIQNYLTALNKYEKDIVTKTGSEIYNLVFSDIEPSVMNKKKLIIIPDKQLLYLPFETLCKRYEPAKRFTDFSYQDYLINDFEITYHYSAGLWASDGSLKRRPSNTLLAFAPVFSEQYGITSRNTDIKIQTSGSYNNEKSYLNHLPRSNVAELPFSLEEIDSLNSLSVKNGIVTDIFTGKNASEKNLKENITNHRFIHIATHIINDYKLPEYSGLLLSDYPDTTGSEIAMPDNNVEGILYAWEIYPMSINAELVTMSACESGMGKLEEGEGVIGLVRAFLSAGAGNVLFSYWKVGDRNTMMFMNDFYDNIYKGDNLGTALRKAKLTMINNPDTSYPLLWGAFSIIGRQTDNK